MQTSLDLTRGLTALCKRVHGTWGSVFVFPSASLHLIALTFESYPKRKTHPTPSSVSERRSRVHVLRRASSL